MCGRKNCRIERIFCEELAFTTTIANNASVGNENYPTDIKYLRLLRWDGNFARSNRCRSRIGLLPIYMRKCKHKRNDSDSKETTQL